MNMHQHSRITLNLLLAGAFAAGGMTSGIAGAQTVSVPGVSAGAGVAADTSSGTGAVPRGNLTNTGTGSAPTGVGGNATGIVGGSAGAVGGTMGSMRGPAASNGAAVPIQRGNVGGRAQGAGEVGLRR